MSVLGRHTALKLDSFFPGGCKEHTGSVGLRGEKCFLGILEAFTTEK